MFRLINEYIILVPGDLTNPSTKYDGIIFTCNTNLGLMDLEVKSIYSMYCMMKKIIFDGNIIIKSKYVYPMNFNQEYWDKIKLMILIDIIRYFINISDEFKKEFDMIKNKLDMGYKIVTICNNELSEYNNYTDITTQIINNTFIYSGEKNNLYTNALMVIYRTSKII